MRKEINKNLEKRMGELFKKYPLFSQEEHLISNVRFWISQAASSLIPESALAVAEGYIDIYKNMERNDADNYLIKRLRSIVENAYGIDCNKTSGVETRK